MAWINDTPSDRRRLLRGVIVFLVGLVVTAGSFAVSAEMRKLNSEEMRSVSGGEGIAFTLNDFHVSGNNSLEIYEGDRSCCDGGLRLEDFYLHESGAPSNGVTTGTVGDPITLDVGASNNGIIVIELPDDKSNMEKNTIKIGAGPNGGASGNGIYFTDSGDGNFVNLGGLNIRNAQFAGETRLAISGTPNNDGGIRLGLAIELNGDIDFDDPTMGGFALNGVHGSGNYSGTDYDHTTWSFSGPLRWADIPAGRPVVVNFQATSGNGELMVEFNPDKVAPTAGTLAVEEAWFQGQFYGEVLAEDIQIRNLQVSYSDATDPITHDLGGYTAPNF